MVINPNPPHRSVWIGFDPREAAAFAVARNSIRRRATTPTAVHGIVLDEVRDRGLYYRPTEVRDGRLFDVISDAPMATEFALSRFLVPKLAGSGWALFMDCDMMVRANINRLFDLADSSKAVMVVKHDHRPAAGIKMDNQVQTSYARKNWSSVILFNCDHPANAELTVDRINSERGLFLHQFCWLKDDQIGELDVSWNWLVGHSPETVEPNIVHFTDGIPTMAGYENCAFAEEWRDELRRWAR